MQLWKKKPIPVEVLKFERTLDFFENLNAWEGAKEAIVIDSDICFVRSLEGDFRFKEGDYIVKGVIGEFWIVRGDIFEMTYEYIGEA